MKCDLCKKQIETKRERYVRIEDYDKEKFVKGLWMHLSCFKKGMNRDLTQMEKQAKDYLERAKRIFDSDMFKEMFPKKEKEYEIV